MEKNIRHFEEKGQRELPFVEAQYQSILQSKGEEAARAYLTDYTADFIGRHHPSLGRNGKPILD